MADPSEHLSDLIGELGDALAEERQALLSAVPDRITSATRRKTLLADRIEQATSAPGAVRPDPELLASLARYNQESAVICEAMLRHLTEAIDRLHRIDPHRSYNPDGSEQSCPARHALGAA